MTIPHPVVEAVLRGFYRRDPARADKVVKLFLRSVVYLKDGEEWTSYHPSTGFPLGMFVEGYTLLQYAINRYITSQTGKVLPFDAVNDDMIVGSRDKEAVESWRNHDLAVQQDLGMSVKGSKTAITTDRFIYCEEYWDGDGIIPKDCLFALAILGAKYAVNVVHAKELVNSLIVSAGYFSSNIRKAVIEVQNSYHYEFSPEEVKWPYLFGGWWPCYRDGLDSSIEWRTGDCVADAAYWACRERIKLTKELKTSATLAFGRKRFLTLLEMPTREQDILALQPLFGSKRCLRAYYQLLNRAPREVKRKYHSLYMARQRTFRNFMTGREDMPNVTQGYLRRHPNSVIVRGMVGVQYTSDTWMVSNPRTLICLNSVDAKLIALANQGLISVSLPSKVTPSQKELFCSGITEELKCPRYPMPFSGMPLSFLQGGLKGVFDFYNRTKLGIAAIDDDDGGYQMSKHWLYIPLPLAWLWRISHAVSNVTGVPELNENTAAWWLKATMRRYVDPSEFLDWGESEDPDPLEAIIYNDDFEQKLLELLDSVKLDSIKAKLIPLGSYDPSEITGRNVVTNTDGLTYVETSAGCWLPTTAEAEQTSFWDEPDSGSEVGTYLWDS
jgi:hypothetical protein